MKSILYTFSLITILTAVFSCESAEPKGSAEIIDTSSSNIIVSTQQFDSSKFALGQVSLQTFSNSIDVPGIIVLPQRSKANVSSLIEGTVGACNWIEGQWVDKGTRLFSVTNPELINWQEEYLILQNRLTYEREEVKRQAQLAAENLSTQKDLYKIKSELSTNETKYSAIGKKLNLYGIRTDALNNQNLVSEIEVYAPISGYISSINVLRGSYITPSDICLQISNHNRVFLDLSILEKDAHLLERDQKLKFSLQGNPSQTYEAKVILIGKTIDQDHMIHVHADIIGSTKDILPGMYANVEVLLGGMTSSALPKDGVVQIGQKHYVLKLINMDSDHYEFEQIVVHTDGQNDEYIALPELSDSEDQYLTSGAYYLIQ